MLEMLEILEMLEMLEILAWKESSNFKFQI